MLGGQFPTLCSFSRHAKLLLLLNLNLFHLPCRLHILIFYLPHPPVLVYVPLFPPTLFISFFLSFSTPLQSYYLLLRIHSLPTLLFHLPHFSHAYHCIFLPPLYIHPPTFLLFTSSPTPPIFYFLLFLPPPSPPPPPPFPPPILLLIQFM